MIWLMYGSPAWHVSTSMISLTSNSVFLQSNVKSSLIYSDLLPLFFPTLSVISIQVLAHPSLFSPFPSSPSPKPTSMLWFLPHFWLKRFVSPVLPSRMGTVLFSSALLSHLYDCGLRNPELLCGSSASVLSLGAALSSAPVPLLFFAANFFLSKHIFMKY